MKECANHFALKNRRPQNNTAESVAMYCENMMGMHGLWWSFLIAIAIAIALVAVFVVWRVGAAAMWRNRPRETAHEILRRRLGSGDINAEEYEKRKALLDRGS